MREEFVKPIMFSGGIGYMPHNMIKKNKPGKGLILFLTLPFIILCSLEQLFSSEDALQHLFMI